MSLFPFHTNLTNSVECLCILAFSLHYIRDGFLSLITSSPFSLKLKLGKCIGTLLKILLFFDDSFLFPILYQAYKQSRVSLCTRLFTLLHKRRLANFPLSQTLKSRLCIGTLPNTLENGKKTFKRLL